MKTTTNYGLKKPDGTDLVNIDDFNFNADKIDAALKTAGDNLTSHNTNASAHSALLAGKAAASHKHSAADITSGTLSITRGGTGATTAAAARTALGLGKALTFTGAVSASYDGTTAKTVNIPEGAGGKRTTRFTVGTSKAGWTAKDCDYLCDGTADQVEINAAIQALPVTGGEIVILDGTYNITAKIAVNKDNVTLRGNGQATVLKRMWNSGQYEGIITIKSNGNAIYNLVLHGNKISYTSSNNSGIFLYNSSSNNTISGNMCSNNGFSGIYLYHSNNNNIVTGNTCNDNVGRDIFLCSLSNNNIITGNTCNNNDACGIYLFDDCSNNTVHGNICNNTGYYSGIWLCRSSNNTVTGNTCNDNLRGIWIYHSSNNNTVTGNTCNDNDSYGIHLDGSSNNTVTGNTCIRGTGRASDYTSSQYTIYLEGSENKNNLIACNNIMGKNYSSDGGTNNTFAYNKYE